ncbi:serine/threonine protein kinase, partial [Planctomycetota bacterium]
MPPDSSRRSRRTDRRGGRTARPAPTGSGRAPGSTDPLIGHTVGGHKILQRTGSDSICVTYKANHSAMARLVAFKTLKAEAAADQATLTQFYDTAKAAAQIHHPNILSIYDVSTAQNVHFCTMEFAEGRTVGELLKARQKIASDDAVRVAIDVAEALRFANAKGMPGFRLSADRVMLSSRGEVKILPPTLTPPGAAVLDEAYVLRAVGTLLYAMLTGGRVDNLEQALDPDVPAPGLQAIKKVAIGTRKAIADVVDRLVGAAGQPYANVDAALAELRQVLQKQEVAETRTRTATERAKGRKLQGLVIAGIAIGVGVVCVLVIAILLASSKARRRRILREYGEARIASTASIDQGKVLYERFWNAPTKDLADKTIAWYEKGKEPYGLFIASHPNTPEAQEAHGQVDQINDAIGTLRVRTADRIRYLKELNAYSAVREAFKAEVA